jgi:adenosylcobinamide-GDP ribazoletransferase
VALIDRAGELSRAAVGAVGFCTRLPVGHRPADWQAFQRVPAAMVLAAYPIGALAAVPVAIGLPVATAAFLFPVWLSLLTGITHLDGLADLGDAAAVHGDSQKRRDVMTDSAVGVGGVAAVALAVLGLALAAATLAVGHWVVSVAIVLTAEVSAKVCVVGAVAVGEPTHEGLGSALSAGAGPATLAAGIAFGSPLVGLAIVPSVPPVVPAAAFAGSVLGAGLVLAWVRRYLGGVSGDVFGAINELSRVLALHAGVIAWTI